MEVKKDLGAVLGMADKSQAKTQNTKQNLLRHVINNFVCSLQTRLLILFQLQAHIYVDMNVGNSSLASVITYNLQLLKVDKRT